MFIAPDPLPPVARAGVSEPLVRRGRSGRFVGLWLLIPLVAVGLATSSRGPRLEAESQPRPSDEAPVWDEPQVATPQPRLALAIDDAARTPIGLFREGTELRDELGRFHRQEGRIVFRSMLADNSWIALENLNLERVAISLQETGGDQLWSVSGELTEFQGDNYLFIRHAVKKGPHALNRPSRRTM